MAFPITHSRSELRLESAPEIGSICLGKAKQTGAETRLSKQSELLHRPYTNGLGYEV